MVHCDLDKNAGYSLIVREITNLEREKEHHIDMVNMIEGKINALRARIGED